MTRRVAGRWFVVSACLVTLLGGACTPSDPPAPPATSSAPTPTENAQEREERLAYEAAETSYREFRAEFRKVTGAGGATRTSPKMRESAAGPYLADAAKVVKAYKATGSYTTGSTKVGYVQPAGYSATSLVLDVCEDETAVKTFDSERKKVAQNGILVLRLEVHKIDGSWKVWDFSGEKEKSCA